MPYFSKYAEEKFDILNKYKVFYTREQIEDVVLHPEKIGKKDKFLFAEKDGIKVLYTRENDIIKIHTFFPKK